MRVQIVLMSDKNLIHKFFRTSSKTFWKSTLGTVTANDLKNGISMGFDKVFLHPSFRFQGPSNNDIALLQFIKPVASNVGNVYSPKIILPVCVPQISKRSMLKIHLTSHRYGLQLNLTSTRMRSSSVMEHRMTSHCVNLERCVKTLFNSKMHHNADRELMQKALM
jgi:hypothetical protein